MTGSGRDSEATTRRRRAHNVGSDLSMKKASPFLLVMLSGFTALIFQLLWMRQLGLLFGNTAHAAAMTLALFFAGLALGSWAWGRASATARNPLRGFAGLQVGIAVTALFYFAIFVLFRAIYPAVYQRIGSPALLFAVKVLLAGLLIVPPAFFMGGTVPMVVQARIRRRDTFGARAAGLYAANIVGAALGALATGFFFVRRLGFTWTAILAILTAAGTAAAAFFLARGQGDRTEPLPTGFREPPAPRSPLAVFPLYAVCFVSGFGFLALEVLWTHLMAQVHTNSVYSFAIVLVIVLLALGLGAAAASRLARLRVHPTRLLATLLMAGGAAVTVSPFLFMRVTDGFQMLDTGVSFQAFTLDLLGRGAIALGLPAFFLALIFPSTLKAAQSHASQPGETLGRLAAIDTVGSILGALLCGFVFLERLGTWRTMQWMAALYLGAGLLLTLGLNRKTIPLRAAGVLLLALLFTGLSPVGLRATGWDPARPPAQVLDVWETSHGTVSVILDADSGYVITLNSNYWLGSTGATPEQHFQGKIPLLVYPDTRSLFFLGMGTGISVGGALDPRFEPLERIVVCELIPKVVTAARKYMTGDLPIPGIGRVDLTRGLFRDPRVEIVVEDGRHFLMASGQTFDMINGDLFLPYERGAGSLYSREHFQNARASLTPDGVFVQWLPMYQLTEFEFGVIARTMIEVFDQVTLWRNHFLPGKEVVALIGHPTNAPLPPVATESLAARMADVAGMDPLRIRQLDLAYDEETVLVFYAGNLTVAADLFRHYPLNTDSRPVIEYAAPVTITESVDGFAPTLVGPRFVALVDRILQHSPPETDPMLSQRSAANRRLVRAGAELHRFWLARAMNRPRQAADAWQKFSLEWTNR